MIILGGFYIVSGMFDRKFTFLYLYFNVLLSILTHYRLCPINPIPFGGRANLPSLSDFKIF